jgi:hypothetical protein
MNLFDGTEALLKKVTVAQVRTNSIAKVDPRACVGCTATVCVRFSGTYLPELQGHGSIENLQQSLDKGMKRIGVIEIDSNTLRLVLDQGVDVVMQGLEQSAEIGLALVVQAKVQSTRSSFLRK